VAHVEDRWTRPAKGPDGNPLLDAKGKVKREPTERDGRGRRWRARYEDAGGKGHSQSFDRKAGAERFLVTIQADLLRGTYLDPDAGKVTLRTYAAGWLAARPVEITSLATLEGRVNNHILPGLGDKRLDQLARSPSIIQAWVTGLAVGSSYATDIFGTLSSILAAAVDDGLITRNPCKVPTVRTPKTVRNPVVPWTADQVAAVRKAVRPRFRAMADCGSGLGMRQGEIFGLEVDAIGFLRRKVTVRLQVRIIGGKTLVFAPPKGGRVRDVPLPSSVSEALARHLEEFPPLEITLPWRTPDGKPRTATLLFTSYGHAVNRNWFNQFIWRPARLVAGIEPARANGMHILRHTYASTLLHGGVDIRRLSAYLGHHSAAFTLAKYAHLMPDAEEQTLRDIDAALSPQPPVTAPASSGGLDARS
jgi:integrase